MPHGALCRLCCLAVAITLCHGFHLRGLQRRLSNDLVVTTSCSSIRLETYRARLDVTYFYAIEYPVGTDIDLSSFGRAIGNSLASVLGECDERGRPVHAIMLDKHGHVFVTGMKYTVGIVTFPYLILTQRVYTAQPEVCKTKQRMCQEVIGMTSVYMDGAPYQTEKLVKDTIESLFDNATSLADGTGAPIVDSQFLRFHQTNLIVLGRKPGALNAEPNQESTSSIPLVATTLAAFFSLVVMLGALRWMLKRQDSDVQQLLKNRLQYVQARKRSFFENLPDDDGLEPGWMTTCERQDLPLTAPSVTWSVSDMTSDSHSIKSSLPMDRIEEEDAEYDDEEESSEEGNTENCSSPSKPTDDSDDLKFICHWNTQTCIAAALEEEDSIADGDPHDVVLDEDELTPVRSNRGDELMPLEGCQFVLDISIESSELNCSSEQDDEDLFEFVTMTPVTTGSNDTQYFTPCAQLAIPMLKSLRNKAMKKQKAYSLGDDDNDADEEDNCDEYSEGEDSDGLIYADAREVVSPELQRHPYEPKLHIYPEYALTVWYLRLISDLQRGRTQKRLTYA